MCTCIEEDWSRNVTSEPFRVPATSSFTFKKQIVYGLRLNGITFILVVADKYCLNPLPSNTGSCVPFNHEDNSECAVMILLRTSSPGVAVNAIEVALWR